MCSLSTCDSIVVASEGLLDFLPPELLSIIMEMTDFNVILNICSINLACKAKMGKLVTVITNNFVASRLFVILPVFPNLRKVHGTICVESSGDLDKIFELDLSSFTIEVPSYILDNGEKMCCKISQLTRMESVKVQTRRDTTYKSPYTSTVKTLLEPLISWDNGIVDLRCKWADDVLRLLPYRGILSDNDWDIGKYHHIWKDSSIDTLVIRANRYEMPIKLSTLVQCTGIRSILVVMTKEEKLRFMDECRQWYLPFVPANFQGTYASVEIFQIPVKTEQIPDLIRIFPNVKKVTVFIPAAYPVSNLRRDDDIAKKKISPYIARYPGVFFDIL